MSISVRVVGVSRKCHFARLSSSEGPVLSAPTLRRAADLDSGEVMSALEDHIAELRAVCAGLPDRRKGPQPCGGYTMADIGLSAFSLFFMGSPSFLAHQRALSEGQGRSNCQSLFDTSAIPSDNYIRQMLDGAPTAAFDPLFIKAIETPEVLPPFQRLGGRILIALDGTEYHCSRKIHCSRCSTRKRSDGGTEYFHSFLGASIVAPGHQQVLPLPPEFIVPQDGAQKQDCERNAAKRWLARHGAALAHARPVFLGDDLFACQPIAEALVHEYGLGCISPPRLRVLFDTDGDRHAEAGHLVEGVAGDFGFGLLIGQSPGMKTPADDGLVAIHRRLHEAPPAISRATLPSKAAVLLDRTQMLIALRRAGLTENGC